MGCGRQTVTDKADLAAKVMRCLRSLQKLPAWYAASSGT